MIRFPPAMRVLLKVAEVVVKVPLDDVGGAAPALSTPTGASSATKASRTRRTKDRASSMGLAFLRCRPAGGSTDAGAPFSLRGPATITRAGPPPNAGRAGVTGRLGPSASCPRDCGLQPDQGAPAGDEDGTHRRFWRRTMGGGEAGQQDDGEGSAQSEPVATI